MSEFDDCRCWRHRNASAATAAAAAVAAAAAAGELIAVNLDDERVA